MSPNKPYMYLSVDGASDACVSAQEVRSYPAASEEQESRFANALADAGLHDIKMIACKGGIIVPRTHEAHSRKISEILGEMDAPSHAFSFNAGRAVPASMISSPLCRTFDFAALGNVVADIPARAPSITGSTHMARTANFDHAPVARAA